MKKKLLAVAVFAASYCYAQDGRIGINTVNPKTTLDVSGKTDGSGVLLPSDITGLQAPRLTRTELTAKGNSMYGLDQRGALVYITDVSGGNTDFQRVNITSSGYYFFDGSVWVKVLSENAVTAVTASNGLNVPSGTSNVKLGGALTENTIIPMGSSSLTFDGSSTDVRIGSGGNVLIGAANGPNIPGEIVRLDVDGISRADKLVVGASTFAGAAASIRNEISTEAILILTGTNTDASVNSGLPLRKVEVTDDGKVAIAAPGSYIQTSGGTRPSESLDVGGNVRFRGVPSGTETTGDKMLVLASDGTAKLLPLPSSTSMNVTNTLTSNYTASAKDDIILFNNTTVGTTLTLPTSGVPIGKRYYLRNTGSQSVTVLPATALQDSANLGGQSACIFMYVGGTGTNSWMRVSAF